MFSRLQKNFNLDFLDNKLAEEQERQRPPSTRSSSSPRPRRPDGGADPTVRRSGSRLQVSDARRKDISPARSPDPEEFAIGDDTAEASRAATPTPTPMPGATAETKDAVVEGAKEDSSAGDKGKEKAEDTELPLEVRQKLTKLETLTARYQDLLRNYRTAHAHVAAIEPFEATLREHTPLTSISDPGAFVEFLNQRSIQSDMVMEELKRINGQHREAIRERDELKVKLEEAEKKTKEAFDEAAGLRKERAATRTASTQASESNSSADPLGVATSSAKEDKSTATAKDQSSDDEFFSHDAEVAKAEADGSPDAANVERLEKELQESKEYIHELSTDLATVRTDLEKKSLDLEATVDQVRVKDEQIKELQSGLDGTRANLELAKKDLQTAQDGEKAASANLTGTKDQLAKLDRRFTESQKTLERRAAAAEENLRKHQQEHAENLKDGKYAQRETKRLETLQGLVQTLKGQVKTAEDQISVANGSRKDLEFSVKKMESEAITSGKIIASLRAYEDAAKVIRRRLLEAERERDDIASRLAESKKSAGTAEAERNNAYRKIIDCGKCEVSEIAKDEMRSVLASGAQRVPPQNGSEIGESSHVADVDSPTTTAAPVDGREMLQPGDGKKKSKKNKKNKKKAAVEAAPTVADGIGPSPSQPKDEAGDPSATAMVPTDDEYLMFVDESLKQNQGLRSSDPETRLKSQEEVIVKQSLNIIEYQTQIQTKDAEVTTLQEQIRSGTDGGSESLNEQMESLQKAISDKDARIEQLQGRLKGEAELQEQIDSLKEENETFQESILENGTAATNAKHELKMLQEQRDKLQAELDEVQRESDENRKKLKSTDAQMKELASKYTFMEAEMSELKNKAASSEEMQQLKEQLDDLQKEKEALQVAKDACDKQIEELQAQHSATGAASDQKHRELSADFEKLKSRATELEKELAAADQLAQTRFKDLGAVRELYNKVQPELKRLRDESAELKTTKSDLEKANTSVRRLEGREKDLKSEIALHKSNAKDKDADIATLTDKAKKNAERSTALEDSFETARKDLEKSESTRNEALEARDRLQGDLSKMGDELKKSKATLDGLQKQVQKFSADAASLRDELQLKAAQQASAQSLMDSMDNQTREMSIQMKEVRERNASLEEELADANRMLSERSRDAETMRRMLTDAQTRAESRVKEMRDKMDLAVEERDRAEDDVSSIGRKRAREIEELKHKLRDAERDAARASEAREEAEKREHESKRQRDELDRRAAQAHEELAVVRSTLRDLEDTLDEGERHARDLERQAAELKKEVEEKDARLEKLQKSGKTMAEELRSLQTASKQLRQVHSSSRSSMDSSSRVTSPNGKAGSNNGAGPGGNEVVDTGYLKHILLQFLEQKDKKYQMQLVPVLGMLLHFDRQDEQKWMAAITTK